MEGRGIVFMKKKNKTGVTAVLATSIAFGTTPMAAGAVNVSDANENYAGVLDWTEEEWNTYLQENHGTTLEDYETAEDLENEVGEAVNPDELANGNFDDTNVLEMMEKYNMSSEDLANFLNTYDNLENIHFIGDLEAALQSEGVIAPTVNNGTTDEGTNGGTTTNEGTANEGTADDNTADGTTNNEAANDRTTSNGTTNTTGEGTTNQGTTNESAANENTANNDSGVTQQTEDGARMPDTDSNGIEKIMIGTGAALIGAAAFVLGRRRQGEQ